MITVKIFTFNSFQVNTYLLYDESGEAIIMDPACGSKNEVDELTTYVQENNLQVKAIINTHGHIDHIIGVNDIRNIYSIPFKINSGDNMLLENALYSAQIFGFNLETIPSVDEYIDESTVVKFGTSVLKPYHIPGHSPGSLVFYSEEDKFVIVGDVLFNGSIGRTDLPGGDYDSLISGIKEKLLTLPGDTKVYSGHGPATTIQAEYDTNPFLK